MKPMLLALSAIIGLLFSGCTFMPSYTRPEAPIPDSWPDGPAYYETAALQQAPAAVDLDRREFLTDERLREVVAIALENNRDLRVTVLNLERARALYGIQRVEILPTIGAVAVGSKQRVPKTISDTGRAKTVEEYSVDLGIASWEIDFFGRIRSLKQKALEEYLATEQAVRSARILLVSAVADAYLTLAADRENLQLARFTLEAQRTSYDLIHRRFEVGLTPELDVRQVQTRVDTARVDVARYTERVARDENALNLLVGSPVPADLLPETLSSVKPLRDVSPGMTSTVLLRRPDIIRAENLLKAANANIGAARAALFPRISLTTAVGTASSELSDLFQSGTLQWNFTPSISIPIFYPGTWWALKLSKVDREIALAQYEQAIQSAFREVADALAGRGTIADQIEAQRSLVEATAEAYRLSDARYRKGTDIYLNVLDAQRSLYTAQQGLISTRLAELANQVRLYTVLGGGGDLFDTAGSDENRDELPTQ